ncbi:SAM-dependent DNA methyltransferase [Streptomyces dangxiongensis]|uniref:site-specific DNA-methyltransferase (adenine-specific) n=1 Tax=Streptomyces dangxiongensis TaxID=1442032 RepID=A0A3G2JDI4_9ACTN|nr:class I SAM-dependent DNA methyltransferase [Streptomyces dangxiongensis]AYN39435.1 SAM-dependent DNA methyltransferase [Streptomyces dangxiongensis]
MITGDIKARIDRVWDTFWSGGISNPTDVIEQITYLLFIRRLDDLHTAALQRAQVLGRPVTGGIFPEGTDEQGRDWNDLRWSVFRNLDPDRMYEVVDKRVFPFLQTLGVDGSTFSQHMEHARLTVPNAYMLDKVVGLLSDIPMQNRDTNGDLYEYMLGKLSTSGTNGQFRTPRHIIDLMVNMTAPRADDVIIDPACGTAGFLVVAEEYVRRHHAQVLRTEEGRRHFHHDMFHGFDTDPHMLRIGSMNMLLHGIENPDIQHRDSLSQQAGHDEDKYSLILANPPFAGSLDYEQVSKDLLRDLKTRKTELLFLALFLRLLKPGGRAAVVVPDGVLFGSSAAHRKLRRTLVEDHHLSAIVKLPSGVFKPYAGVSTAILFFTRTGVGGTDDVWFYDVKSDGMSLDDKRTMLVPADRFGPVPAGEFVEADHERNNLPDVLRRWAERETSERSRPRTEQSFTVPRAEIAANDYDLSINRYKEVVHEEVEYPEPADIIENLKKLDAQIRTGLEELEGMLA